MMPEPLFLLALPLIAISKTLISISKTRTVKIGELVHEVSKN
jgi:hypothetical protein